MEETTQNVLGDVKPEHYFITKKGKTLKNLEELHNHMAVIEEDEFRHHVNDKKNDFHNWVRDVHKDKILATNLLKAKTRVQTAMHIKNRIQEHKAQIEAAQIAKIVQETAINEEEAFNDQPQSSKHSKTNHIKNVHYMKARVAEFALGILFGASAFLVLKSMA